MPSKKDTEAWHISSRNRANAKAKGENKYISGKACPSGHLGPRYTGSGKCVECATSKTKEATMDGYFKENYKKTSSRKKDTAKDWYKRNSDKARSNVELWQSNNKEKVRAYKAANKMKRKGVVSGGVTSCDISEWLLTQDKLCSYCGIRCDNNYHIDHVIPISRGGKHVISNLAISCPTCNMRKSAKTPDEFLEYLSKPSD